MEQLGLFMIWLRHASTPVGGTDTTAAGGEVLSGPGAAPARGARRVNAVLAAVRGLVTHAVTAGTAPGRLLSVVYELTDDRDVPAHVRGEEGRDVVAAAGLAPGPRARIAG